MPVLTFCFLHRIATGLQQLSLSEPLHVP